jgi:G2/mitotic-specific cyclin-B, other
MEDQPYINERMRTILVNWLVEVHLRFKMVPETLYLTVCIIDRVLEKTQIRRSKLQLVGIAALSLSAKLEEIYPPEFGDMVYITDQTYNKQEIFEMEIQIFSTLNYNLRVPTIHTFICRYLKAAHADRMMVQMACYISERALQEYTMVKYLPSIIAASAVFITRKSLGRHPWSPTLVKYTKYDESDLINCLQDMNVFMNVNQNNNEQQAVYSKYSREMFGSVSTIELVF